MLTVAGFLLAVLFALAAGQQQLPVPTLTASSVLVNARPLSTTTVSSSSPLVITCASTFSAHADAYLFAHRLELLRAPDTVLFSVAWPSLYALAPASQVVASALEANPNLSSALARVLLSSSSSNNNNNGSNALLNESVTTTSKTSEQPSTDTTSTLQMTPVRVSILSLKNMIWPFAYNNSTLNESSTASANSLNQSSLMYYLYNEVNSSSISQLSTPSSLQTTSEGVMPTTGPASNLLSIPPATPITLSTASNSPNDPPSAATLESDPVVVLGDVFNNSNTSTASVACSTSVDSLVDRCVLTFTTVSFDEAGTHWCRLSSDLFGIADSAPVDIQVWGMRLKIWICCMESCCAC